MAMTDHIPEPKDLAAKIAAHCKSLDMEREKLTPFTNVEWSFGTAGGGAEVFVYKNVECGKIKVFYAQDRFHLRFPGVQPISFDTVEDVLKYVELVLEGLQQGE